MKDKFHLQTAINSNPFIDIWVDIKTLKKPQYWIQVSQKQSDTLDMYERIKWEGNKIIQNFL